jgi:hypothetical protein
MIVLTDYDEAGRGAWYTAAMSAAAGECLDIMVRLALDPESGRTYCRLSNKVLASRSGAGRTNAMALLVEAADRRQVGR